MKNRGGDARLASAFFLLCLVAPQSSSCQLGAADSDHQFVSSFCFSSSARWDFSSSSLCFLIASPVTPSVPPVKYDFSVLRNNETVHLVLA